MTGTSTDISERTAAEAELIQANATVTRLSRITELAQLTASIAHEVNQPLCAIVANANASLRWLDMPAHEADLRSALQDLVNDSHRASEIIRRTEHLFANNPVRQQALNLNDVINDALVLAETHLKAGGIELVATLSDRLPIVTGDRLQIQQVVLNLVLNAADAMRAVTDRPRTLRITSRPAATFAMVSVEDNGERGREKDLRRAFEPFYTTKPGGLGIGLAVSRRIIQTHGGVLIATPNAEHGATFRFTIPTMEDTHG
jgi:C4-dicarboxylate-specific signal transduction histidine kinase